MALDLTKIKGLFFDIYATLIDWEAGIYPHLLRLSKLDDTPQNRMKLLHSYADQAKAVEHENPTLPSPRVNEKVYARIAADLGVQYSPEDQVAFGRSIGEWPAYPDTVEAMKTLGKYYKLFVLSNVDNASFERTRTGPLQGTHWDGIYTAEMIGSYKPNPNNYRYVVQQAREKFSIKEDELLSVAQSLDIDHVSTKALGLRPGIWIARNGSAMGGNREELEQEGLIELAAVYPTLGDFAAAVEKAFA